MLCTGVWRVVGSVQVLKQSQMCCMAVPHVIASRPTMWALLCLTQDIYGPSHDKCRHSCFYSLRPQQMGIVHLKEAEC